MRVTVWKPIFDDRNCPISMVYVKGWGQANLIDDEHGNDACM